ncbi:MAG: hypothetical protein WA783_13315 [Phormidesmis sp.]
MSNRLSSRLQRLWFQSVDTFSYPLHDAWRRSQQAIALSNPAAQGPANQASPNQASPNPIVNQKEIRDDGMRRTGNHAIIAWIEHQLSGKYWHLNNLTLSPNPTGIVGDSCFADS